MDPDAFECVLPGLCLLENMVAHMASKSLFFYTLAWMAITLSVILIDCVYLADPHRAVRPNCDWGQVQMVRQRSQI